MATYVLSMHQSSGETVDGKTERERQHSWQQIEKLNEELKAAGAWVFGGALLGPDATTVVRIFDGEVLTTNGPYAEGREHVGGFYIVESDDVDSVLGWAAKAAAAIGRPIEVRPFRDADVR